MHITLAQINPIIGNITQNTLKVIETILQSQNSGLLIFPEMTLLGYPAYDLIDRDDIKIELNRSLKEILKASILKSNLTVIIGSIRYENHKKFNTLFVLKNGRIIHTQDKQCLPNYDVFQDKRHFEEGEWNGIVKINGKRCALMVCEDIWANEIVNDIANKYKRHPLKSLKKSPVDLIICSSASPFEYKKHQKRYRLFEKISKYFNCKLVFVNTVGAQDDIIFDGRSMLFNEKGVCQFIAPACVEDISTQLLKIKYPKIQLEKEKIEDIYNALVLGIKDYIRKSGSQKVVLGLSGGIDSAVTACLAVDALGVENVTGITMPSEFSSSGSVTDSQLLAKLNNITCRIKSITSIHHSYRQSFAEFIPDADSGIVDENIQSRIRTNILMAYSNKTGALILSTGNKTELAMGYSTLYGDMSGAISVLGDLWKTSVYALANFLNQTTTRIPQSIITKAPSAELRHNQKDQDTLPDYRLLDEICDRYIVFQQSKSDIVNAGFDTKLVNWVVKQFHQNEYKRFQSPPILRVSSKAFGPSRLVKCTTHR